MLISLLNQTGAISDKTMDNLLAKVNIVSDAFQITANKVKDSIKEIEDVLQDDLNKAVENTLGDRSILRKKFDLSITTGFAKFEDLLKGVGGDEDGTNDPVKVEVDPTSQSNTLATAGSIEEFNLIKSQRKEELNILKKIADNTAKSAKQSTSAGFTK